MTKPYSVTEKSIIIILCLIVAFLGLGDLWYELVIKIIAFIYMASTYLMLFEFIIKLTGGLEGRMSFMNLIIRIVYLLFLPVFIYICVQIYFL